MLALLEGLEHDVLRMGHPAHELHDAVDAVIFEDLCFFGGDGQASIHARNTEQGYRLDCGLGAWQRDFAIKPTKGAAVILATTCTIFEGSQ